jgi:DNA repair photolyase
LNVEPVSIKNILTRTTGYLTTVSSHSAQPYRGCTLGLSLCGVGCYVRHNRYVTAGREWGTFLEARENAAESYLANVETERRWGRKHRGAMSIFLSSSTEPFLPQEDRLGVTRGLLEAIQDVPPDELIVQTHSHRVARHRDLLRAIADRCRLRVHISIETDREDVPGLPSHASTVESRFDAARSLREVGIFTVVTVSPILPVKSPDAFFARIAESADAVVLDHFIEGDGTPDGRRTLATPLPGVMADIDAESTRLEYRERLVAVARRHMAGRVGLSIDGFAGRYG